MFVKSVLYKWVCGIKKKKTPPNQYSALRNASNQYSENLIFKIFWVGHALRHYYPNLTPPMVPGNILFPRVRTFHRPLKMLHFWGFKCWQVWYIILKTSCRFISKLWRQADVCQSNSIDYNWRFSRKVENLTGWNDMSVASHSTVVELRSTFFLITA